jgi:lipopolysaccharide export system permease protein
MFILWRHILRTHVAPFFFSVVVLVFIFLLQALIKFLDQLAGKGLSVFVIAEWFVLSLSYIIVLAVPMGILVATLMAFGNLAANNEITAIRATGVSLYYMMIPPFFASIVLCWFLIQFNNDVLPDSNHKLKVLTQDIYRKKPTLTIVPGLFSQEIPGYSILVRKTFEHSNDLEGITIFDNTQNTLNTTITAERGTISFSPDYRKLIMDLSDGEINEVNAVDFKEYRRIRFVKHRIAMDAQGYEFQRSQESSVGRSDREMSAADMRDVVDSLSREQSKSKARIAQVIQQDISTIFSNAKRPPQPYQTTTDPITTAGFRLSSMRTTVTIEQARMEMFETQKREYEVEIYKKYSIPVACIVFVFVGAPLGIIARKGSFGVSASVSLGFFLFYWACLLQGEQLANRGFLAPWFGMWVANIVIGIVGLYLTYRIARENLVFDWTLLTRFVPKRLRTWTQDQS